MLGPVSGGNEGAVEKCNKLQVRLLFKNMFGVWILVNGG